jgi:hypothetical protein
MQQQATPALLHRKCPQNYIEVMNANEGHDVYTQSALHLVGEINIFLRALIGILQKVESNWKCKFQYMNFVLKTSPNFHNIFRVVFHHDADPSGHVV